MIKRHSILPSNRIVIRYSLVTIVLVFIVAIAMPYLLNYPPGSINTDFDIEMSYISYTWQFILICILGLLSITVLIKISFKNIDKWYQLADDQKYQDKKFLTKLIRKCFQLPYILFLLELIIPILVSLLILCLTGSHYDIMLFKLLFLLISFSLFLAVTSFVFSKDLYTDILSALYNRNLELETKIPLYAKIFMQVLPISLIILLVTSLIGYSKAVAEKEEILFDFYHSALLKTFDLNKTDYTEQEIVKLLNTIELYDTNNHHYFIIDPNGEIISNVNISDFIIKYTQEIAPNFNGKTYDSYGKDIQGSSIILKSSSGVFYVGIIYDVTANISLTYLIYNFFFSLFLMLILLHLFAKSFSKDLTKITTGLKNIQSNKEQYTFDYLPITSNDEIGDLVYAFNNIQDLTRNYIQEIHNSQEILIEKERLATLGQMIGGIAHNLKTPIMSISGAREALQDLVKEYDTSIGDKEVTNEDHHEISREMQEWLEKMRDHLAYMSDIITTVKGQAVNMSETVPTTFSIYEVLKQVDILMKHELKNALITLNVNCKISENTELKGNINSLVQVINNIISNAIQSYNGATNKSIDLLIFKENNDLIIAVNDYGSGMSKSVQDKLFKSMITTKGKKGTGLGLFMSYSNIKAHFNGDISFESEEGRGTTFYIHLPLE